MNKLLPCPFCGSSEIGADSHRHFVNYKGHSATACAIYCLQCSAEISECYGDFPDHTENEIQEGVLTRWNTRHIPEPDLHSQHFGTSPLETEGSDLSEGKSIAAGASNLYELSKVVHTANIKWWQNVNTGGPIKRNKGELLALIHSEISEALEGERKNLMDDKLPQYPMAVVEIIDAIIRELDYLAGFHPDINIQEVFDAKMSFNAQREDHKHEARRIAGGKQF